MNDATKPARRASRSCHSHACREIDRRVLDNGTVRILVDERRIVPDRYFTMEQPGGGGDFCLTGKSAPRIAGGRALLAA